MQVRFIGSQGISVSASDELSPPSAAIHKRADLLRPDCVLIWPPADALPAALEAEHRLAIVETAAAADRYLSCWPQEATRVTSAVTGLGQISFDDLPADPQLLVFMPKAKQALYRMFKMLIEASASSHEVLIVGEKRSGVDGIGKSLVKAGVEAGKVDSLRHCQIWRVSVQRGDEALVHWLDAALARDQARFEFTNPLTLKSLSLNSGAGVFSFGQLDEGTQLLLRSLCEWLNDCPSDQRASINDRKRSGVLAGRVLDFGCGNGVISAALAQFDQSLEIIALDTSAYACESTAENLAKLAPDAQVIMADGVKPLIEAGDNSGFDWIISNPPFHEGLRKTLEPTLVFFESLSALLRPGGRVLLVANSFLPYQQFLQKHKFEVTVLQEDTRFTVMMVKRVLKR
ncbi:methyltransferase [Allohahella marinimesophila]|uniref:Uncharacterized protein n=1 Tax=Allohahella marinimesophila TaxID=1054972 RepID=A0ABP7Q5K0_9GAMM